MTSNRNAPCPCGSGKKYKKCCGAVPPPTAGADSALARLLQAAESGDHAATLVQCREALGRYPDHAGIHHVCAVVHYRRGDAREALRLLERAARLAPRTAAIHSHLALVRQGLGQPEAAEQAARAALAIEPELADAHNNLANVLKVKGEAQPAIRHYRAAVAAEPHNPLFLVNLGSLLQVQGEHREAEAVYRRAIAAAPDWAPAHANLGALLLFGKRYDEAEAALRRALALAPDDAEAVNSLGLVFQGQGRHEAALEWFRRALETNPRSAGVHSNLGLVLEETGDSEGAIAAYAQALACDPQFYPAYQNLLGILVALGRVDRAYPLACTLLDNPRAAATTLPIVIDVLGQACDFERRTRAWRLFEQLRRDGRINRETLAKALFSGNYESSLSEQTLLDYHRAWGGSVEAGLPVEAPSPRQAGARLRIGYLSPDFRQHPVGYFIQHILAARDRARFEVYCYSNSPKHDPLTEFIRSQADRFIPVATLSDEALAQRIRDDRVDILVDLAGHTSGNRLTVLARRPAPVQMTWIGYLNTTGLSRVDYRISDPHADPDEGVLGTERLLRLPECFLCFGDFPQSAVEPVPACERHGVVTFASFNNLMKLTAPAVRLWAEILQRVPGSRLVVMALGAGSHTVRTRLGAEFERHGLDPGRLVLQESLSRQAYFDFHNEVDIVLDTFPYNGGTVTCGALWMGVPVVTRVGPAHRQRVSYSLLKNIGLDETIAADEAQYVEIAVRLATAPATLAQLRRELPGQVRHSVLCDAPRFARQLEEGYRRAWEDYLSRSRG
jgi:predicted O-linked N-acetylglucosamine transferase (SPINDLY family)